MHPEQIKAELRIAGTTSAQIARNMGLRQTTVSMVIHGKSQSARVKKVISEILGKPVESIWTPRRNALYKKASA